MSETQATVINTINDICRPERPDLSNHDKPLLTANLDSLDFASVLMALEDEYKISFEDVDLEAVSTVNKLVAYIDARKKA